MEEGFFLSAEKAYELLHSGQAKEVCERDHNIVTLFDDSGNSLGHFVADRLVSLGESHRMIFLKKPEQTQSSGE